MNDTVSAIPQHSRIGIGSWRDDDRSDRNGHNSNCNPLDKIIDTKNSPFTWNIKKILKKERTSFILSDFFSAFWQQTGSTMQQTFTAQVNCPWIRQPRRIYIKYTATGCVWCHWKRSNYQRFIRLKQPVSFVVDCCWIFELYQSPSSWNFVTTNCI